MQLLLSENEEAISCETKSILSFASSTICSQRSAAPARRHQKCSQQHQHKHRPQQPPPQSQKSCLLILEPRKPLLTTASMTISNTTALPVIAPPAPFPFLRLGNQKASKQVCSRRKAKSQIRTSTSAHAVLDKDLHRQRENRLQNSSAASSTTTTTTTNTSNATTPRAATSSCSASGESPFQTKPSPLLPQRKAKS
jgi:hypothetical protein